MTTDKERGNDITVSVNILKKDLPDLQKFLGTITTWDVSVTEPLPEVEAPRPPALVQWVVDPETRGRVAITTSEAIRYKAKQKNVNGPALGFVGHVINKYESHQRIARLSPDVITLDSFLYFDEAGTPQALLSGRFAELIDHMDGGTINIPTIGPKSFDFLQDCSHEITTLLDQPPAKVA